jgi:CubicO group peptidase (beta-lactamase class C family)
MNRLCASVFPVAFSASHVTAQSATTAPPVDLDAWVARAMSTFHTPGVAVAVVKDGKLVHSRGYGVRRMGAPEKVDADTLSASLPTRRRSPPRPWPCSRTKANSIGTTA